MLHVKEGMRYWDPSLGHRRRRRRRCRCRRRRRRRRRPPSLLPLSPVSLHPTVCVEGEPCRLVKVGIVKPQVTQRYGVLEVLPPQKSKKKQGWG